MATLADLDPSTIVGQMRLNTGDYIEDEPFLSDDIYLWFYQQNGNSVLDGSIEALESIINYIALTPDAWRIGEASESKADVQTLSYRLADLKLKKRSAKAPIIIKTDRKNWNDFTKAFGENDYN